ncbi:hypothetical protein QN277_029252 [Acacia crassicarpa]|uniref:Uncharacterized protein n=1 Tax=Acacia crassicarpa TaxID=499986 RepID=A0AAE1J7T4_9FABA|nr:hypothetical protein QN277_029252 [Acacia crassicarpa]
MAPHTTSLSPLSLGPTRLVVADKLFTTRHVKITPRRRRLSVSASSNKDSYDGKLVDENMIVLRVRIREIQMEKMKMMNNGGGYWRMMEWERRYWQQNYASDVCQAVGLLQNLLMETRPCLAFSILLLVLFSFSFSMSLSVLQVVGLGKHIFMSMNF